MSIDLWRISKTYCVGNIAVVALHEVTLSIADGEFLAIVGPSGSGKSTLMNILGCLDSPTSGTYLLDGRDVARLDDDARALVRRRKVGFVFQHYNLLPRMRAIEQVELPLMYAGVPNRRQRALSVLTMLGLSKRAQHRPMELSGGEQQRVAIARALALNPGLILADEPTGALDSRTGEWLVAAFDRLNRETGLTVIIVTHDSDVAAHTNRIVQLRDGRIVSDTAAETQLLVSGAVPL